MMHLASRAASNSTASKVDVLGLYLDVLAGAKVLGEGHAICTGSMDCAQHFWRLTVFVHQSRLREV